jgi:SH3-like domain-containing protein
VKSTSFKVAGVEPYDVLNIRNGPSQDHDLVGEISPAAGGIVITGRCVEDWCPIRHRNVSGWVNRYYLAEEISH